MTTAGNCSKLFVVPCLGKNAMSLKARAKILYDIFRTFARQPKESRRLLQNIVPTSQGISFSKQKCTTFDDTNGRVDESGTNLKANPLKEYFDAHREGRGIWKWEHYFDIYHTHFSRFVGREVYVVEIGIFSGGSLDMWKSYFGPKCHVIGVDIQEECKVYQDERTKIFIGDQGDRKFWKRFREEVPVVDIVVDDGGHDTPNQIVTLEELLPHLRPGGVYCCEDVQEVFNRYAAYVYGIADSLNDVSEALDEPTATDKLRPIVVKSNEIQRWIRSIHLYPYVTVLEKTTGPVHELVAHKHGTQWQPFL
jgi:hypothetical protein